MTSIKKRYQKAGYVLLGIATLLFIFGLTIGYEYWRARTCYNSFFETVKPAWCNIDLEPYSAISIHWFLSGAVVGCLILILLAAAVTCAVISRTEPKSFGKPTKILGLVSLVLAATATTALCMTQIIPDNNSNWQLYDRLILICACTLLGAAALFLIAISATITCAVAGRLERKHS